MLTARGVWATNDKLLLSRAGLRDVDELPIELRPDPATLADAGGAIRARCEAAVAAANASTEGST